MVIFITLEFSLSENCCGDRNSHLLLVGWQSCSMCTCVCSHALQHLLLHLILSDFVLALGTVLNLPWVVAPAIILLLVNLVPQILGFLRLHAPIFSGSSHA